MSTITLPYDINNGDALDADKVMANENAIVTEYNAKIGAKAGDPVTTAEVQELSNKTLVAPIIKPVAGAAPTVAGTLGFNDTTKQLVYGNGTSAIPVGQQYRAFTWYLDGTSVNGVAGATYIAPQNMTVTKIYGITTSGTCVATIKKGSTTIDAISCSGSLATETTITDPAISAGDVITLTLSSSSSPVGLKITCECSQP